MIVLSLAGIMITSGLGIVLYSAPFVSLKSRDIASRSSVERLPIGLRHLGAATAVSLVHLLLVYGAVRLVSRFLWPCARSYAVIIAGTAAGFLWILGGASALLFLFA